jgi:hypothetical protein
MIEKKDFVKAEIKVESRALDLAALKVSLKNR